MSLDSYIASNRARAEEAAKNAEDAELSAISAKDAAETAANIASIDGFVDQESNLPNSSSDNDGDVYVVQQDNQARSLALYKSDGLNWNYTGISLISDGRVGNPNGVAELDGSGKIPDNQANTNAENLNTGSPNVPTPLNAGKILAVDGNNNNFILDPSDFNSKEDAIQEAINGSVNNSNNWDGANQNGGGKVVIPENILPYDSRNLSFSNAVSMVTSKTPNKYNYDLMAYGADPNNNDTDISSQKNNKAFYSALPSTNNINRRVFVPTGKYYISNTVTVYSNQILVGENADGSLEGVQILEHTGSNLTSVIDSPNSYVIEIFY